MRYPRGMADELDPLDRWIVGRELARKAVRQTAMRRPTRQPDLFPAPFQQSGPGWIRTGFELRPC